MRHGRSAVWLLVLAAWISLSNAKAQNTASPPSAGQPVLYLNGRNAGQHVAATVGQPIQITLGTVGPGQYESPQISSSAVRFERVAFAAQQIPAGPTLVYHFLATSEGEAEIEIPHAIHAGIVHGAPGPSPERDRNQTFLVTIRVHKQPKP